MTITQQHWKDAARFAGVDETTLNYGWYPRSDWNDFGPLWVKLEQHIAQNPKHFIPSNTHLAWSVSNEVIPLYLEFRKAKVRGDAEYLMQAGCELAAAIGATMTTTSAGEKA